VRVQFVSKGWACTPRAGSLLIARSSANVEDLAGGLLQGFEGSVCIEGLRLNPETWLPADRPLISQCGRLGRWVVTGF
jgi:hypothetical protein